MAAIGWLMRRLDGGIARVARFRPLPWEGEILLGVATAILMLLIRKGLDSFYGDLTGFMILLPAVIVAGLAGGLIAGTSATITCLLGGWLVVGLQTPGAGWRDQLAQVATVNFIVVGLFATVVAASLRKTVSRLDASLADLGAVSGEARQADLARRQSEAQLKATVDQASAGIARVGMDGRIVSSNARFAEILGRPLDEVVGIATADVSHDADVQPTLDVLEAIRQSGAGGQIEKRYVRPDGSVVWALTSLSALSDEQGRTEGFVAVAVDITEAKNTAERLQRQEARHRFLLDLADSIRDLSDPHVIIAEVQQALGLRLQASRVGHGELDVDKGVYRLDGSSWTQGVAPLAHELRMSDFGDFIDADLSAGRTVRVDDVTTDPRTAPIVEAFLDNEARAFVIVPFMQGGRVRAFMHVDSATARSWTDGDIGLIEETAARTWSEVERARALAEVAESEARFRAIADTAPVLIWVTRQDRERAFVNQAYVQFYGGTYEDARSADWRTILHPDDQERVLRESIAGEATGQPFSMEARYLRHDRQYRWLKSFSRPRIGVGGAVVGFVGVAFDVTDAREAQALLAESEARFRTVADSAPALIWMTDAKAGVVFANRRYKIFFDVDVEDVMGDRWRAHVHPGDLRTFSMAFLQALRRKTRFEWVMQVQHPVLGLRWLRSEGVPRFDAEGVFQGYVGASLDITDAKRAEDDLKRINELLEERVGEALAEKARAEAHLMHAQRMEAVGRLTGGVAHDFNNLLTVVIGALDMILKSPDDGVRRKKLGEAALAAARRGERLTHQLLAFSRRQALRPEPVDLNAQILEGEPLLRRAVGEAVDFRLKLRRGGAHVSVDPAQFEAALLNLIVNARDAVAERASRRGQGRITVQTLDCEVAAGEVHELAAGRYVCVVVTDNGAGMDPVTMTRVFEPFFTTKSVGKGTGLGLSQVYGFTRQSGGGIQVSSTVGRGTEVRLYLPPLEPAETPAETPVPAPVETALPGGRRLLLVEDDVGVAAVALELLRGMGLEVEAVESGAAALAALERGGFDVMLSDVVMPGGMSGIDLARQAAALYPRLRILLTSGYAGDDVDEALSDAPWPFIRKPYSGEDLRRALGAIPPPEQTRS